MNLPPAIEQYEIRLTGQPLDYCVAGLAGSPVALFLDGSGFSNGWQAGPLLALDPDPVVVYPSPAFGNPIAALESIEDRIRRRRRDPGTAETGLAVLLAYEALDPPPAGALPSAAPRIVALAVDASVRFLERGRGRVSRRIPRGIGRRADSGRTLRSSADLLACSPEATDRPAHIVGSPRTSLPHRSYLDAVGAIRSHIAEGDLYQANLCQQFSGACRGSPVGYFRALVDRSPAPWSAFLATDRFALVSVSPELFLRVVGDRIETWPIKGTRPRGATPVADRAAARELIDSAKDRAELLMIVDLERNDLGRVCRTGSVVVEELAALQSFAAVHHLVARIAGRLRPDAKLVDVVRATFPGGSISGAPKIRARQILRRLEPVERGFFTGSLCWFGDDGSTDSSILIRSMVFRDGRFELGAGGGIVADSDPESEWQESNHKALALASGLGFSPEEAS